MVLTGKPLVFAAGADIDQFPGITAEQARAGQPRRPRALRQDPRAAVPHARRGQRRRPRRRDRDRPPLRCAGRLPLGAPPRAPRGLPRALPRLGRHPAPAAARRSRERGADDRRQPAQAEPHAHRVAGARARSLRSPPRARRVPRRVARAARLAGSSGARRRPPTTRISSDVAEVCRRARSRVDDVVHGAAPAPYRALELIEGAATWSLEEGYRAEEDAMAELLPGDQAQASIYAFDVVERRMKRGQAIPTADAATDPTGRRRRRRADGDPARDAVPSPARGSRRAHGRRPRPRRAGARGDPRRARRARRQGTPRRGQGALPRRSRRRGGSRPSAYAGCDLVIEAVFEELAVKQEVLGALEAGGLARVPPRHEHLVALDHGDGRAARAPGAR